MTRLPTGWAPVRFTITACLALGVTVACGRSADLQPPSIGATAPAFEAVTLEGSPVALDSLKGQVVVLNVWATWCIPCLEEIPQLQSVHRTYGAQGVAVVGVSIDAAGMGADVKDFMDAHDMGYTVWLDPARDFPLRFLTVGVPETFVLDRAGVIRWRMTGAIRPGDTTLVAAIRDALQDG